MNKDVLQVLKEARELLSSPERWSKGSYGRTADGAPCMGGHELAVCWCAAGALQKVCPDFSIGLRIEAHEVLAGVAGGTNIVTINDQQGYEAVVQVFDAAIAQLEE